MTQTHNQKITRIAGILLVASSILALLIMFMHPVINADTTELALKEIVDKSAIGSFVHGALIVFLIVFTFGYVALALELHEQKVLGITGLILYVLGVLAYTQAALISGFISPGLAESFNDGRISADSIKAVMNFAHLSNQALAKLAVFATGIAFMLWSWALWSKQFRIIPILGVLIGLAPIAGLMSGALDLHVSGMTLVVVLQVIWNILIGWLLANSKI